MTDHELTRADDIEAVKRAVLDADLAKDDIDTAIDLLERLPVAARTTARAEPYEPTWEELKAAKAAFVAAGKYALTIDALKTALIAAWNAGQGVTE